MLRLGGGQWIKDGQTVLGSGATGSGKSYLDCALGHQGVPQRHLEALLPRLPPARRTDPRPRGRILSQARREACQDAALHPRRLGTRFALRLGATRSSGVLDDRYARRGTLLASQVRVGHWHDVIGDPTFDDTSLDRLLNNAHQLTLKGGSMRRLYDSTKTDSTP